MGLFSKIGDAAVSMLTKQETIRLPYEELVKIVEQVFISGSDDTFLALVRKTAKGGFIFPKELKSNTGRYIFHVGTRPRGLVWLGSKPVWILDQETDKFYQLDRDLKWGKFFKSIDSKIKMEKINRNR